MDHALRIPVEMTEKIVQGVRKDLEDVTPDEAGWRPLPEANSIALIVRHLAIEASWHLACLERGEPMPYDPTPALQQQIDAVPLDFERNRRDFVSALEGFLAILTGTDAAGLRERSTAAYAAWPSAPAHMLAYHQAMHVCMHWGQIRTIRNLYEKTRGRPARYFPDNPSYPRGGSS